MRAENYINVRKFIVKSIRLAYLLGKTASHRYKHIALFCFQLFKHTDIAEGMIFGVLSYTAGVKNRYVAVLDIIARRIAHARQYARNFFGFVHVHLTAVGCNMEILAHTY